MDTVSTHSRAEAAALIRACEFLRHQVSTHSRAEAAAFLTGITGQGYFSFNTQPRGGGCKKTLPPTLKVALVSTHSRAEAAA